MSNLGGRQWQLEDLDAIAKAMRVPMPIMEAFTDTHGRAAVRVLVDLPGLGIAAGSEFLTLEAGQ